MTNVYTGRPCRHGHRIRYRSTRVCVECCKARSKRLWRIVKRVLKGRG